MNARPHSGTWHLYGRSPKQCHGLGFFFRSQNLQSSDDYFPSQNLCIFPNADKILESGSLQERLVRCVLCKVLPVSKVRLIDWALEAFYENFKHFKSPMTTVSALISRFQQTVSFGTFNFNVKIKTLFNSIELVLSPQLNGQYFAQKIGSSHLIVQ